MTTQIHNSTTCRAEVNGTVKLILYFLGFYYYNYRNEKANLPGVRTFVESP